MQSDGNDQETRGPTGGDGGITSSDQPAHQPTSPPQARTQQSRQERVLWQIRIGREVSLHVIIHQHTASGVRHQTALLTLTCSKFAMARSKSQSLFFRHSSANCKFSRVRRTRSSMSVRCGSGYTQAASGSAKRHRNLTDTRPDTEDNVGIGYDQSRHVPKA